ncbi:DMT family transporter [Ancylobacter lacus]|uniref:DMT family transporter n=1 Tax=Ancylobacter lacus TaxID=2579970 RepID=UPI001BCCC2F6|nr:DMT family transporter [Ancylobacter lacus]MBS7541335.1 DMT family transporter [Ancylobacter lacus]
MSPPPPASLATAESLESLAHATSPHAMTSEALEARQRRQAFAAVLLAAVCIGSSAIFVRLSDVGPAAIGFWRLIFSLGPTALWAYAELRTTRAARPAAARRLPFSGRQLWLGAAAGFFFATDLVLFHAGLARTATANGLLLGNMAPVFVVLMGWLVLAERPTLGLVAALALGLGGAGVIILRSGVQLGGSMTGDLMCLAAASAYSAYMLFIRVVRRPTADGSPGMGGGMVSLVSSAAGAVFCLAWALGNGETLVPQSLQGLLAVAGLGILTHAAGQGLTTFALGRLPAGLISVVLLLQILVGVTGAALLFGEVPSLTVMAGGVLIVAGVLAVRPR